MKLIHALLILLGLGLVGSFIAPSIKPAYAQSCSMQPSELNTNWSSKEVVITYSSIYQFSDLKEIRFICSRPFIAPIGFFTQTYTLTTANNSGGNTLTLTLNNSLGPYKCWQPPNTGFANPALDIVGQTGNILCAISSIPVEGGYPGDRCKIGLNPNPPQAGQEYDILIKNLPGENDYTLWLNYHSDLIYHGIDNFRADSTHTTHRSQTENYGQGITLAVGGTVNGTYYDQGNPICKASFKVGVLGVPGDGTTGELSITDICSFIPSGTEQEKCLTCFEQEGVYTPFDCIETNPQKFVERILRIAIGVAGGIAFLMIIYGGFVTMTSAGNPERLTSGKEIITSAIAGLLLIIFSVVILRIIGVDILKLPGLGG